jgi:hypothetical protein
MDKMEFSDTVVHFKICYRDREKANRRWLKWWAIKFQKRMRTQSCAREQAGEIIQKTHDLACSVNSVEIVLKWTRWQMKWLRSVLFHRMEICPALAGLISACWRKQPWQRYCELVHQKLREASSKWQDIRKSSLEVRSTMLLRGGGIPGHIFRFVSCSVDWIERNRDSFLTFDN